MSQLKETIDLYGVTIPSDKLNSIQRYCQLLWHINRRLNLTRHTDYTKFVTRDLADTVQLSNLIPRDEQVLDVGSGGGVPGLLLAILRPDLEVTCTDSVGKKATALSEIATSLRLDVEIYHGRAEHLLEDFRFGVTTARAVGPLAKICGWFGDHWPSVGRLLAVKGPRWTEEKQDAVKKNLLDSVDLKVVSRYQTPGTEWESVILQLTAKRAPD